jgi:hypothetical protein
MWVGVAFHAAGSYRSCRPAAPARHHLVRTALTHPGALAGLEVQDHGMAAEVGQPDALAVVGRELEVRCGLALLDHGERRFY